jgi:hypothetical protein
MSLFQGLNPTTTLNATTHLKSQDKKSVEHFLLSNPSLYATLKLEFNLNYGTPYKQKFYRFLVDSPEDQQSRIYLYNSTTMVYDGFVIAKTFQTENGDKPGFTCFRDHYQFIEWNDQYPPSHRNCFEIVRSGPQKPHFDVDIKDVPLSDLDGIASATITSLLSGIQTIMTIFRVLYDPNQHLLVFTSHGENKRSFHIVLRGLCHDDEKEAKNFYDLVVAQMPENVRAYVDNSVYKKNQQFRLLGNEKMGSNRPKQIDEHLTKWYPRISDSYQRKISWFEESAVGLIINDHVWLPSFKPKIVNTVRSFIDSEKYYNDMITAFEQSTLSEIYKVRDSGITNGLIPLDRISIAWCSIHKRRHDNENAFLTISTNGDIFIRCGQGPSDGFIKIGSINHLTNNIEDINSDLEIEDSGPSGYFNRFEWENLYQPSHPSHVYQRSKPSKSSKSSKQSQQSDGLINHLINNIECLNSDLEIEDFCPSGYFNVVEWETLYQPYQVVKNIPEDTIISNESSL